MSKLSCENELRTVVSMLSVDYREKSLAHKAAEEIATLRRHLSTIVANAIVGPDAAMNGSTDCYHVPLDDIEAARDVLAKEVADGKDI